MKLDAATIAKILGGKPEGGGYLCSCPVKGHGKGRGDLRPSLSVSDGKRALVFHCFAGCKPRDIIAALNALAPNHGPKPRFESRTPQRPATKSKTTTTLAQKLWKAALPVAGTPAETYLRARRLPPTPPPTIRFLPSYRYDETRRFPCLIAAVQAPSRAIVAVQLTFLDPSGLRKADVAASAARDRAAWRWTSAARARRRAYRARGRFRDGLGSVAASRRIPRLGDARRRSLCDRHPSPGRKTRHDFCRLRCAGSIGRSLILRAPPGARGVDRDAGNDGV